MWSITAFTDPPPDRLPPSLGAGPTGSRLSSPSSVGLLKGNHPCRFPRPASDTLCLSASCCSCTARPHLAGHPSSVYLSSSQKNAYHNDKCVISDPVQTPSPPGFTAT